MVLRRKTHNKVGKKIGGEESLGTEVMFGKVRNLDDGARVNGNVVQLINNLNRCYVFKNDAWFLLHLDKALGTALEYDEIGSLLDAHDDKFAEFFEYDKTTLPHDKIRFKYVKDVNDITPEIIDLTERLFGNIIGVENTDWIFYSVMRDRSPTDLRGFRTGTLEHFDVSFTRTNPLMDEDMANFTRVMTPIEKIPIEFANSIEQVFKDTNNESASQYPMVPSQDGGRRKHKLHTINRSKPTRGMLYSR